MERKKLVCYYSDFYKKSTKEVKLKIIVINHLGYVIYDSNKNLKHIKSVEIAKYVALCHLITSLESLEEKLKLEYSEEFLVDIISYDRKVDFLFDNVQTPNNIDIYNYKALKEKFALHKYWNIRYDHKSKNILKKIYLQNNLSHGKKRLKGFKLPRKKFYVRKVSEVIEKNSEKLVFFDYKRLLTCD